MVCRLLSLLLDKIQRVVHVIWTIQKYLDVNVCLVWMVWMVWLHWFGLVRWRQKMEILSAWNNWPMEASRDLNVFPCVSLSTYPSIHYLPIRLWLPLFASSPLCLLKVFYFHRLCLSVCLFICLHLLVPPSVSISCTQQRITISSWWIRSVWRQRAKRLQRQHQALCTTVCLFVCRFLFVFGSSP